jgi:hypothetical protein
MTRLQQRKARLRAEYGFDFPDDFFRFWEFLSRLSPLEPLRALGEFGITAVGPFEVLAGRFDGRVTKHSLLLHWRYHDDPPEFFTVLAGDTDRLHWGYVFDDPDRADASRRVAHYYASDGLPLTTDGDDLFAAVRLHAEHLHADNVTYRDESSPEDAADYDLRLEAIARLRERLLPFTPERPEIGDEYVEAYADASTRSERVVAKTRDGVGIVVEPHLYRRLSMTDKRLIAHLRRTKDPLAVVNESKEALREGFPGTALKLGHDLWGLPGPRGEYAAELLDAAYAALGRETLRRVLRTHAADRTLPSVDVLEQEEEEAT